MPNRYRIPLSRTALAAIAATLSACGGGTTTAGAAAEYVVMNAAIVDGRAVDGVEAEDEGFATRSLAPAPRPDAPQSAQLSMATASDAWVTWPESLAANVPDADNEYTGTNQRLFWPGVNGATKYENHSNCAGFVTRSLKQAFNLDNAYFTAWMGSTGPSSARYHDNIVAGNRFVQITRVGDIQRGDIVAIKYIDAGSGGTGHTMIAQGTPTARAVATKPIIANTVQYELRIIDSTSSPHGATDTRRGTGPNGTDQDGAGFGTVRIYADAAGTIKGYTWSLSTGSTYFTATSPATDRRSLVVGRLGDLTQ